MNDKINPDHYKGVEINGVAVQCIDVIEVLELGFHLGNALKYAWRLGRKHDRIDEEIAKCLWYLDRWQERVQPSLLGGLAALNTRDFKPLSEAQMRHFKPLSEAQMRHFKPLSEAQMRHFELLGNLRVMCGAWKQGKAEVTGGSAEWMCELITLLDIEDAVVAHVSRGK